jgi:hypothetical protein
MNDTSCHCAFFSQFFFCRPRLESAVFFIRRWDQRPRARICRPFMEPRNRFPPWRNRLLGSISVPNTGSVYSLVCGWDGIVCTPTVHQGCWVNSQAEVTCGGDSKNIRHEIHEHWWVLNPNQNGQGWKWPCCVCRQNAFKCLKSENSEKYQFLLLAVFIWTIIYFSAEIKFLSMILVFFRKFPKSRDKICPCIQLKVQHNGRRCYYKSADTV